MSMSNASSGFQKSLVDQFRAAAAYVGFDDDGSPNRNSVVHSSKFPHDESSNPPARISKMPVDVAFFLYGAYQQGTIGPCGLLEPTSCSFVEHNKWRSWKQLSHISSPDAMVFFLALLEEEDPRWYSRCSSFTLESDADVEINSKRMETQVLESVSTVHTDTNATRDMEFEFETEQEEKTREIIMDSKPALNALTTVYDQWVVPPVSYPCPIGRSEHGAALIDDKMYVYGGNHDGCYLDDLEIFDLKTWTWSQVKLRLEGDTSPMSLTPLASHSLIAWNGKLLSIGGYMKYPSASMQVRVFDLGTSRWSILGTTGEPPVSRGGHSVTLVGSKLVIFGGEDAKLSLLNDLHILDLERMTWENKKDTLGVAPSPRSDHVAAVHAERYFFIFGGASGATCFNDLHVLDLQTMEWSMPVQYGEIPIPRVGYAGVAVGDSWFIVGGNNQSRISQTVVLNMSTFVWSVVTTVQGRAPLAGEGLSLVLSSHMGEDILISYGGYYGLYNHEVSVLKPSHQSTSSRLSNVSVLKPSHQSTSSHVSTVHNATNASKHIISKEGASPRKRIRWYMPMACVVDE